MREMVQSVSKAQQPGQLLKIRLIRFLPVQQERHDDVLPGGENGKKIELLKDKTDFPPAESG